MARGVGSPRRSAAAAWAYSWILIARMRPMAITRKARGLLKSVDNMKLSIHDFAFVVVSTRL